MSYRVVLLDRLKRTVCSYEMNWLMLLHCQVLAHNSSLDAIEEPLLPRPILSSDPFALICLPVGVHAGKFASPSMIMSAS